MSRNRILAQGRPGTMKTGALAALANAGYKIRMIDFEGNTAPLYANTLPENRQNIAIASVRDKITLGGDRDIPQCTNPVAFRQAWRLLDNFVDNAGNELGSAADWGDDTVLVIDGITQMGEACMRRILAMMSHSMLNRTQRDWGVVQADMSAFFNKLESDTSCHVYAITHLKMVGPKLFDSEDKNGPDIEESQALELNSRIVNVIPTRMYPTAPGQQLAQTLAGSFDTALFFEAKETITGKVRIVINTKPCPGVDVKCPAVGLAAELPGETGLLTIFQALKDNQGPIAKPAPKPETAKKVVINGKR